MDANDLVARAEALHHDLAQATLAEPSEQRQELLQRACPHAMAVHLLLQEADRHLLSQ